LTISPKYAFAIPARNHEATTVARFLVDKIFTQFGTGQVVDIDKLRTNFYYASCNGSIERFHRTLNSVLSKVVADNQRDWDEHVSYALAAYRMTKHSATGFSPNYLVFGRELAAPFELMFLGIPENDNIRDQNHCKYIAALKDRLPKSYTLVRRHHFDENCCSELHVQHLLLLSYTFMVEGVLVEATSLTIFWFVTLAWGTLARLGCDALAGQ